MCEHIATEAELEESLARYIRERNGIGAGQEEVWIQEKMALHRLLRSRESPPRCLTCGSTRIVEIDESGAWVAHPGGSGRVRVEDAGIHVDDEPPMYTIEGVRIQGSS
jgi:hypothetical protein